MSLERRAARRNEPSGLKIARLSPMAHVRLPSVLKPLGSRERYTCHLLGSTLFPLHRDAGRPPKRLGKVRPTGEAAEAEPGG
jgi:hypothetical protein